MTEGNKVLGRCRPQKFPMIGRCIKSPSLGRTELFLYSDVSKVNKYGHRIAPDPKCDLSSTKSRVTQIVERDKCWHRPDAPFLKIIKRLQNLCVVAKPSKVITRPM